MRPHENEGGEDIFTGMPGDKEPRHGRAVSTGFLQPLA